jgi:hypothetical protein
VPAIGLAEQGHHLVRQGVPILTSVDHIEVPGGVLRPLVDPIPIYAWSMAWRQESSSHGVAALRDAAAELATAAGWLSAAREVGGDTWLPEPDASRLANGELTLIVDGMAAG